jgi:hypothetical protein
MGRIVTLSLAVTMMPMIVFLSPQAEAQQANLLQAQSQQETFRQTQDAAMAAAAGPEFCQRGACPGSADVAALHRSMPAKAPKPAGQAKASGPFPPQPYQSSRSEPQAAAQSKGEGDAYVPPRLKTNFGRTPSSLNLSGNDYMQEPIPDKTGYDEKMRARAALIFPDDEAKRQQWMADQEQRAIANDINRTKPLQYPVSGR